MSSTYESYDCQSNNKKYGYNAHITAIPTCILCKKTFNDRHKLSYHLKQCRYNYTINKYNDVIEKLSVDNKTLIDTNRQILELMNTHIINNDKLVMSCMNTITDKDIQIGKLQQELDIRNSVMMSYMLQAANICASNTPTKSTKSIEPTKCDNNRVDIVKPTYISKPDSVDIEVKPSVITSQIKTPRELSPEEIARRNKNKNIGNKTMKKK
ncbi:MAG: hypothetical protein Faunusvirus47_2 [Faunusvirus sp.]|jgi:hypothetical protein|uniref:Uncharacterized protein n=1 Tax=Faunusvirus sp. TaxID=2487766 RepID=A0A3G5A0I2_9VIRU|nr:MAG: hypothetical protein Faunusvirus47_2 [Faunusvirus sp.]